MSKTHLRLGDRVVLNMSAKRLDHVGDVWADRTKKEHLAIVIEVMPHGDVRVWDTVEGDWWICYAKHLKRLP